MVPETNLHVIFLQMLTIEFLSGIVLLFCFGLLVGKITGYDKYFKS
jgi:hypothetical protein